MARTVTPIPATKDFYTTAPLAIPTRRKVAGYARVSTASDEQFTSYEAQVNYYTNYIKSKPDWDFVNVYTDEGITGTNTSHRTGFKAMVADAMAGKIDLIITKSISRFARNTVDSLTTIRLLKDHGVECYFEKENIWTFDNNGEVMISIMSTLAQEESRSISENVKWGHRRRFADGKYSLGYSTFLGYDKGPEGRLIVNEEQAVIVRKIYSAFLDGKTPMSIGKMLEEEGIPAPAGGKKWHSGTIRSILTNEKYMGDVLLQKSFTVDFLTKRHKVNEGEVQQFYVKGDHEPIIDPEEFEHVQSEIARRKQVGKSYSGETAFSSRIICGECGHSYGPKVWHSTDKYRSVIWQCNHKFSNGEKCRTPTLREDQIKGIFLKAYNELMGNREKILRDCSLMMEALENAGTLTSQIRKVKDEMKLVSDLSRALIKEQAGNEKPEKDDYDKQRAVLDLKHQTLRTELEELNAEYQKRIDKRKKIMRFIHALEEQPLALPEWDNQLWSRIVENITFHHDERAVVRFLNGTEISVEID